MTHLEAIKNIKRVKEINCNDFGSAEGWSEEIISYQLTIGKRTLYICKSESKWQVMIDSECVSITPRLKGAKEVGVYFLLKD